MSIQGISLRPFPSFAESPPILMVSEVSDVKVHRAFTNLLVQISSSTRAELDLTESFARDRQVIGLNRTCLIPYSFETDGDLIWDQSHVLLPRSSDHFIQKDEVSYGKGWNEDRVEHTVFYAEKFDLPSRQMRSPIEGGNCYVFFGAQGTPRAVVGIHSVVLTMIALKEQEFFTEEKLNSEMAKIDSPSDDSVRRARNTELYNELSVPEDDAQEDPDYRAGLTAPVTDADRVKYLHEARKWEAKEKLARMVIAEDLGVPLENIAFVPQKEFHIDMEIFIGPDGENVYVDTARYQPHLVEEIQKIGCRAIPVPGVHKLNEGEKNEESVSFMNGVFVSTHSGPHFVTNGGHDGGEPLPSLRRRFREQIAAERGGFNIAFMPGMQEIARRFGGIHCLTWERSTYKTPLDIILLGYLAEEPVPEQKIRRCLGKALLSLDTALIDRAETQDLRRKRHGGHTDESTSPKRRCASDDSTSEEEEVEEEALALSPTMALLESSDSEVPRSTRGLRFKGSCFD